MATTVQQILDQGFALSFLNRPDTMATTATELVMVVDRALKEQYQVTARENPDYFSTATAIAFDGLGWRIPNAAESVVYLTTPTGTEVVVVDARRRDIESRPAVYQRGRYLISAGNAHDPVSGELICWYAPISATLAAVTDTLPGEWPEQYNGVLIYTVGEYLARKDGRTAEAETLAGERSKQQALFLGHLQHQMTTMVRLTGLPKRVVAHQTEPVPGRS